MGSAKGGGLPWPMLKKEMAYFARVTKRVPKDFSSGSKPTQNVVIMGPEDNGRAYLQSCGRSRRESILSLRVSRTAWLSSHPDVIVATSIENGIDRVQQRQASTVHGRLFIIGGATIYDAAFRPAK